MTSKSPKLTSGSRVAVIGGGPAGSFFSYFLLDMAERVGIHLTVDLYEPRDFSAPSPRGCNMCAGVLHESLVQCLAAEGINLPTTVVQRGLDSNILHMDVGNIRIETPRQEKRMATTFRGSGPRDMRVHRWESLDGHLMKLAVEKGAHPVLGRIDEVAWEASPEDADPRARRLRIKARGGEARVYDLVAVAAGVNTALLKQFQALEFGYQPPHTTQAYIREYYLGEETVTRHLGPSMHAFLLNQPGLDFGALIPKGDYVTLSLLGEKIDAELIRAFVNDPAVKQCLPPDFPMEQFACSCSPRINIEGSARPFGNRIVFIGDSGVTRLYKDGIGSAYRAAKAAARTAIFEGVGEEDLQQHYGKFCQTTRWDNSVGKLIFTVVRQFQRIRVTRHALLRMVAAEQQGRASAARGMSMVLWDMFTGSASYREIFLRTLHPVFWTRLLWSLAASLAPQKTESATSGARQPEGPPAGDERQPGKESEVEPGALGRVYADGEIIIRQGDVGNCMFVVQEGRVGIYNEQGGMPVQLAVRGKGEFFGEMSIFEREVRSATVRALGAARVLTVDETTLLRRIHQDPSLAFRMVRMMSQRIRELSGTVAELKSPEWEVPTLSGNGWKE